MADELIARTIDVGGIPIRYREAGAGRALLLIHGVTIDHRSMVRDWEPVFEGRSGWRRIYPDLPGRGETAAADWIASQDDMLQVTLDFLDGVAPGERFAVGGSSWGGYIALGIVHERSADVDGAAFIVSNPLREGRAVPEGRQLVRDERLAATLGEEDRAFFDGAVVATADTLAAYREVLAPAIAAADMDFIERVEERTTFSFDVRELPMPFDRPSLFVSARQDTMAGYADVLTLIESFPRATFAILDRAGHGVGTDQPVLFQALVGEWLDRIEAETTA